MKRYFYFGIFFTLLLAGSASAQFLVEVFRNVDCANCKVPDAQYEAFVAQHPEYQAQVIYIHNNFPTPADPFYLVSKADVNARVASGFYSVQVDPTVFVSGENGGSSFSTWKTLTQQTAGAINYPLALSISTSTGIDGKLNIDLHAEGTSGGKQVKPFVMLVESGIKYYNSGSYGTPPDSLWNNVFRAMIPSSQGGEAISLSGPQDFHYVYDPAGKPWNFKNCKVIAFLQEVSAQSDNISRKIDGFTSAAIATAGVKEKATRLISLGAPVPNPSRTSVQVPFYLDTPSQVKITISDELGKEVASIFNGIGSEGKNSTLFIPNRLSKGTYYARMYTDGAFVGMQKIVLAP